MNFINPIELLELEGIDIANIDNSIIKKAKRKLFADIDLSDNGHLSYKGLSLTKTDCEKVIDDLGESTVLEFYSYLASNIILNDFLVNGNENLFISFKQESIYKLPEFIKFISPFYAPKFDRALLKAFVDEDEEKLRSILSTQNLLSTVDLNVGFKGISIEIQNRMQQIESLTNDIKNEESIYSDDDISDVIVWVKDLFQVALLNHLPSYFQSQINKIASSINYLQLAIWNEFNTTSVSLNLLEYLLELKIESVKKPVFQKNYEIVKKKHEERVEQEKNAPLLKKWAAILMDIQDLIKNIESSTIQASKALTRVNEILNIEDLNKLPSFANEIKSQIGYSIRSMSISCWNKQNDIKIAICLIDIALQINGSNDAKLKFQQDKRDLEALEVKYKGILICYFCNNKPPVKASSISKTIYKVTYRTYVPRKVEYSFTEVEIPRCLSCQEIHSKGSDISAIISVICTLMGIIIALNYEGSHYILGGIIGLIIGFIFGNSIEASQVRNKGLRTMSETSLSKHPLLIDKFKEGWSFSKPSA